MNLADRLFYQNIQNIMNNGVMSLGARPKYKSTSKEANSKYITGSYDTYDLSKGEFPLTSLRPIPIKSAIKELLWIYQDQTNELSLLRDKYGVKYWDDWDIGDGTIGKRYGFVVKKHDIIGKLLSGLEENLYNRRNIISLWDYESFEISDGLKPCAFMSMFDVRSEQENGKTVTYLDMILTQRSNDMLVAHHINAMQYVALQMMIACHLGLEVGKFNYCIMNLHIYDNQFEQANELLRRFENGVGENREISNPKLVLNCEKGTNFFNIKFEDFEIVDYDPIKPGLKFDLAI